MKNYILLDGNVIVQVQHTLSADPPWIEVENDIQERFSRTRHIYLDGVIIDTKQPALPPDRYMDWDHNENIWVSTKTDEIQWQIIRENRNKLLADSDWTDTLSAKSRLGDDLYNSWQAYRQALRDIPQQGGSPEDIVFPPKPE